MKRIFDNHVLVYVLLGGIGAFTASGIWALYYAVVTGQNLITVKMVGNVFDGIRLIGSNSLLTGAGGNHVITVVILGVFGLLLMLSHRMTGFFRWLWVLGWHEELWVGMLTLVYLRYLSLAWIAPLIFSWAVLFIVAAVFWGRLNKLDYIFVGISGLYFLAWAALGGAGLSSCISTAPFVTNCSNSLTHNFLEIGSWLWMVSIGTVMWA